jgi:predicted DNA-binding transcriptional regulator
MNCKRVPDYFNHPFFALWDGWDDAAGELTPIRCLITYPKILRLKGFTVAERLILCAVATWHRKVWVEMPPGHNSVKMRKFIEQHNKQTEKRREQGIWGFKGLKLPKRDANSPRRYCRTTVSQLARELLLSRKTVQRCLRSLAKKNALESRVSDKVSYFRIELPDIGDLIKPCVRVPLAIAVMLKANWEYAIILSQILWHFAQSRNVIGKGYDEVVCRDGKWWRAIGLSKLERETGIPKRTCRDAIAELVKLEILTAEMHPFMVQRGHFADTTHVHPNFDLLARWWETVDPVIAKMEFDDYYPIWGDCKF